jgi:hypothetical protein
MYQDYNFFNKDHHSAVRDTKQYISYYIFQ